MLDLVEFSVIVLFMFLFIFAVAAVMDVTTLDERCSKDCERLGMSYFKSKTTIFTGDECWCRIGNSTQRIW